MNQINTTYSNVIDMSDDEKMKMYMKLSKVEIIKMLIESNKHLNRVLQNPKVNEYYTTTLPDEQHYTTTLPYIQTDYKPTCQHDTCMRCKGTGIDTYGNTCFHSLYCGCPKCTPQFSF